MAVGDSIRQNGMLIEFAERWDGTSWSVIPMPAPSDATDSRLFGVSCTAANACTAAGVDITSGGDLTLVERWDGSSWSIQPTPNPTGAGDSSIRSVSCTSATRCTAAGEALGDYVDGSDHTLVETWNGAVWSIQSSPNPTPSNILRGVSCASLTACSAVGEQVKTATTPGATLAEGWDGTTWSVQSTPSPVNERGSLFGVSCPVAGWCKAVGFQQPQSSGEAPLAEQYIAPANPVLSTVASGSLVVGGSVSDTATLSGGQAPTGTITFRLFGPDNGSCSGSAAFTSTVTVSGNGSYRSESFATSQIGTYRWTATYSGDSNNTTSVSGCNASGEQVKVTRASPALATSASGSVPAGGKVSDTGTLSAGYSPTGTITFRLYGPDNGSCSGSAAYTSRVAVAGNGTYGSGSLTASQIGAYRWTASYSGDASNNSAVSGCNAPGERVDVTVVPSVSGVSPNVGSAAGGGTVTVTGSGFVQGATAEFGAGGAPLSTQVVSATQLKVDVPAHADGTVHVFVMTPGGTSRGSDADLYAFGPPAVSELNPDAGSTAGGGKIVIFGSGFLPGATVKFGATGPALPAAFQSPFKLTLKAPAHATGAVHVFVTTPGGTSAAANNNLYAFGAPSVTAVSPNAGDGGPRNPVTISGTGFVPGATAKFGASDPSVVRTTIVSATQLKVFPPAHQGGTFDVFVTTPAGTSRASNADLFAFGTPAVNGLSPNAGPTTGGNTVTIFGYGFVPGMTVKFTATGTELPTTYQTPTESTVTAPAYRRGPVHVFATTAAGRSVQINDDNLYTYTDPANR